MKFKHNFQLGAKVAFAIIITVVVAAVAAQGDEENHVNSNGNTTTVSKEEVLGLISSKKCNENDPPGKRQQPVSFHRYYHPKSVNHHYRTSYSDDINTQLLGVFLEFYFSVQLIFLYTYFYVNALIFAGRKCGAHYDLFSRLILAAWGFTYEGVEGKVYKSPATGTAPLHRYYHSGNPDHFYTTNWGELGAGKQGYKYEGIECYVYPSPTDGTVPLYRYWNPTGHDHFYTTNWNELKDGKNGWNHEGIAGYIYPKDEH